MFICKECGKSFTTELNEYESKPKLCDNCFEDALEEYEEKKRERIARQNEY